MWIDRTFQSPRARSFANMGKAVRSQLRRVPTARKQRQKPRGNSAPSAWRCLGSGIHPVKAESGCGPAATPISHDIVVMHVVRARHPRFDAVRAAVSYPPSRGVEATVRAFSATFGCRRAERLRPLDFGR